MKLFGTDGVRGRAGEFPLDDRSVELVGREVGRRAAAAPGKARGLGESGARVAHPGVVPTPAVAELVLALSAAAGISVSASHNPFEDNGIKVFGPDGRKWSDQEEASLEEKLLASRESLPIPQPPTPTLPHSVDDSLAETYVERLLSSVPRRLEGMHIVLDTGNGAAYRVGPERAPRPFSTGPTDATSTRAAAPCTRRPWPRRRGSSKRGSGPR